MTPYTIALAGKAYLTQAICLGKIQQTVGNNSYSSARSDCKDLSNDSRATFGLGVSQVFFKNLPFPHHFSNQPMGLGNKKKGKGISGAFPGIYQNFKAVRTAFYFATNRLMNVLGASSKSASDTAYLTTSFDVIVSKSFSGRGNYKLMPVLHSAR